MLRRIVDQGTAMTIDQPEKGVVTNLCRQLLGQRPQAVSIDVCYP